MRIHFIAIGGNAMHNLALDLHKKGYTVSGSDDEIFEPSRGRLKKYGLLPEKMGWHTERITKDIDAIILGMHARKDNPELLKSLELGLHIYSFPEFIYEQSKHKNRVVIGGSHGKTTITAMIMHVLKQKKYDFDYLVGALIDGFEVMVKISDTAKTIIIEGDEYLSSAIDLRPKFHLYKPHIAVISGIEWDHYNVFKSPEMYKSIFAEFIQKTEKNGCLIYCKEDEAVVKLVENIKKDMRKIPYGFLNYEIKENKTHVFHQQREYELQIFGAHNILNLHAALLVCKELGIDECAFLQSMQSFYGAGKRLEKIAENQQTVVFQDFAHAPSKLRATISAVKNQYPDRSLLACIELHTYSSLNENFIQNYKGTMDKADFPIVYFNPHAVQLKKLRELTADEIKQAFCNNHILVFTDEKKLESYLYSQNWKNKNLLMMSSGHFNGLDLKKIGTKIVSH